MAPVYSRDRRASQPLRWKRRRFRIFQPLGTHIEGPPAESTGLWLRLPNRFLIGRTALRFDSARSSTEGCRLAPGFPGRSVTCAERGQPPGFPLALRRNGRVSGCRFPSGRTESTSGLLGRISGSGGMSPVFRLDLARRRKSIVMDCRVQLGFPCWESNYPMSVGEHK